MGNRSRKWLGDEQARKTWLGLNLLGPLLLPATVSAATHELGEHESQYPLDERLAMAAGAVGRSLIEQIPTYQGFRGIDSLITSPALGASTASLLGGVARLAIPASSLFGTVERMTDALKRDPRGVWEGMLSVLPGVAQTIQPQQDVLGRDIPNDNGGVNVLLPRLTTERTNAVLMTARSAA